MGALGSLYAPFLGLGLLSIVLAYAYVSAETDTSKIPEKNLSGSRPLSIFDNADRRKASRVQDVADLETDETSSPETHTVLESFLETSEHTRKSQRHSSSSDETEQESDTSRHIPATAPTYIPKVIPSGPPPPMPPSPSDPEASQDDFYYDPATEYAKARVKYRDTQIIKDKEEFDFIVVGCGCTGCPLASYLALKGEGRRVLVLERGLERTFEQTPMAMTVYGHGVAAADPTLAQVYNTRNGVRTHVATVMGGGTAIDLAIYVEETESYFNYMNKRFPAYKFHWPTIQRAYRYARRIIARRMPYDNYFGLRYQQALQSRGYKPIGGTIPADYSTSLQMDRVWSSYSLFDVNDGGFRRTTDVFIDELPEEAKRNVVVRTKHNVEWVEFDLDQIPPRAKCVVYRPTAYDDIKPQGTSFASSLPSSSARKSGEADSMRKITARWRMSVQLDRLPRTFIH